MARIRLKAFPATYTPVPFQELAYVAEKKQKRADEGEALITSLEDDFLKVKALPVDKPKRDSIVKAYRENLYSMYDQAGGDVTKIIPQVKNLQRKIKYDVTYGDLGDINRKATEYETLSTNFDKASLEGKFSGLDDYMRQYAIDVPLAQYTMQGGHTRNDAGISNSVPWQDLSQLPDWGKEMSDWFTKYKADKYAGKTLQPTNAGYLVKETNELVRYEDLFMDGMRWVMSNPSFTKVNQIIGALTPQDYTTDVAVGFDKNKNEFITQPVSGATAGVYDFVKNSIMSLAGRESYLKQDTDMFKDWERAMSMKQQMATPEIEPQTFKSTFVDWRKISNPFNKFVTEEGKPNFMTDPQGNIVTEETPVFQRGMTSDQIKEATARAAATSKKNKELKITFDNLRKTIPGTANLSDAELSKFMNDAYTNSKMAFDVYNLPDFNYKELAPQVFGDLVNQAVFAVSEKGSKKNTFSAIAEDLGYTALELKKLVMDESKNGNIRLAPFTPLGKPGYSVEIQNKEGKPANLIISSSEPMNKHFQWLYPVFNMLQEGKVGYSTNKVYSDDSGTYTNIGYENNQPYWYVSRVLSKENTDAKLKELGLTKEEAEAQGIKFSPGGRMHVNDINDIIKDNTSAWMNSRFMKPYRTGYSKSTYDINSDEE